MKQCTEGSCAACGISAKEEAGRVLFTKEMKKTHTILFPTMLPMHFRLISKIFNDYGYQTRLLENGTHGDIQRIIDAGLKYVHNDTCYPAALVIGQFIDALDSGEYDVHKTALMLFQTCGGCRASNYLPLLRKALKKAGYGFIPVISLNFSGIEKNPGFHITLPMLHRAVYALLYGDLLMTLVAQCQPYETEKGSTQALAEKWVERLTHGQQGRIRYAQVKENYRAMLADFAALPRRKEKRVLVGIVGEIFVKYSPLGNNNLEEFLISEGAETTMGGLCDFLLYILFNIGMDHTLYGTGALAAGAARAASRYMTKRQDDMIRAVREQGVFRAPPAFRQTVSAVRGYIGYGTKMGEGWLLPAEMAELLQGGIPNVVVVQPFGCLPNHIIGKGMMKPMKEKNPGANIVAIDYDAGATKINQENRLKLMLANARERQKEEKTHESTASGTKKEEVLSVP